MKKFLLLLVAVVLAGGLVLSCAQPSSYDITLKAGSAEGVAPDSIKVEAINGYNLITWKSPSDTKNDYTVYRKSIIDGEIDEGTIKVVTTNTGITPIKAIAYAQDSSIDTDAQYVYGIVSRGFKEGGADAVAISDLVWQDEPEGGYVKAKKPAAGTELPVAPAVTATAVRVNNSKPGGSGMTDVADSIVITLEGLTPGYTYTVGIAWNNWSTPGSTPAGTFNESDWGYWGSGSPSAVGYTGGWITYGSSGYSVADYLDYGSTKILNETYLGISDYITNNKDYDDWRARAYVQIGSDISGAPYPITTADTSGNGTRYNSNVTKVLDIAK